MNEKVLLELYKKEREYQKCCFGEYSDIPGLNFASFLNFIESYLKKAKESYAGKWEKDSPDWLLYCEEMNIGGSAPIKAYEEIIKVMALAGAALETFTSINADEWRKNIEEEGKKWK